MVAPEPELAPVILPVLLPMVQLNLLGTLEDNEIFRLLPLHVVAVAVLVTNGIGFTVTVIVKVAPTQVFAVEVGITRYCIEPAVVLLGFVNV